MTPAQDATSLADIIKNADWYAEMDANSGLAFHLAEHWPEIRNALCALLTVRNWLDTQFNEPFDNKELAKYIGTINDALQGSTPSASAGPQAEAVDPLEKLVSTFAKRLLAKLRLAQANGRSGWDRDDWEKECQQGLLRHVAKGDPRDVAAYCAFMDHHGWITVPASHPQPQQADGRGAAAERETFAIPEGYEAVRDSEGRATGEIALSLPRPER